MDSISHRELRNSSGAVLAAVTAGETFTVTNNGKPVAVLSPIGPEAADLRSSRPATTHGGFASLKRYRIASSVAETLDALRAER